MTQPICLGVVPHTGWAWVVAVRGPAGAPVVVARERLIVEAVLGAELYHRASAEAEPESWLRSAMDEAAEATHAVVRGFVDAVGAGAAAPRAAVVLGKAPPPPRPLRRILAAHPAMHAAEGELWRAVFSEACQDCGLRVVRALPGELAAPAPPVVAEGWLREAGRALGPPWTRELKEAATAAWVLLAS